MYICLKLLEFFILKAFNSSSVFVFPGPLPIPNTVPSNQFVPKVLALIVFLGITLFVPEDPTISYIVSLSLFTVVIISSLMGTMTPLILNKLGFNPALASGPFITTSNDILGLAIYFVVAIFLKNI